MNSGGIVANSGRIVVGVGPPQIWLFVICLGPLPPRKLSTETLVPGRLGFGLTEAQEEFGRPLSHFGSPGVPPGCPQDAYLLKNTWSKR